MTRSYFFIGKVYSLTNRKHFALRNSCRELLLTVEILFFSFRNNNPESHWIFIFHHFDLFFKEFWTKNPALPIIFYMRVVL